MILGAEGIAGERLLEANDGCNAAGADLGDGLPPLVQLQIDEEYKPALMAIAAAPKPFIAAVNGAAAGIGASFAMSCDLMVMADNAYIYEAFMAIALVPDDARLAASDLGASPARILFEIEMPLAAPGIMVGCLLTFVLSAGAVAEAKLLGGRSVIVLTDDVESAFTFGQNWPLGSALSLMLIVIVAILALVPISRINMDAIMGRKK